MKNLAIGWRAEAPIVSPRYYKPEPSQKSMSRGGTQKGRSVSSAPVLKIPCADTPPLPNPTGFFVYFQNACMNAKTTGNCSSSHYFPPHSRVSLHPQSATAWRTVEHSFRPTRKLAQSLLNRLLNQLFLFSPSPFITGRRAGAAVIGCCGGPSPIFDGTGGAPWFWL